MQAINVIEPTSPQIILIALQSLVDFGRLMLMQRLVFYCDNWVQSMARRLLTDDQARTAHDARKPYCALVDSIERPYCVITVMAKAVVVDFKGDHIRSALSYQFQECSDGRYFLSLAVHREFEGDSKKSNGGTTYSFEENGQVKIVRETFLPEPRIESTSAQTDVSSNYEERPLFGEYDAYTRIERQLH